MVLTLRLFSPYLFERISPSQIDQCWNSSEGIHRYMHDGIAYRLIAAKCCLDIFYEDLLNTLSIVPVHLA